MTKFLFITCLTPKHLLTPLRKDLFNLYLKALKAQTYTGWEAVLLGEENKEDGKIKYLKAKTITKEDKLQEAYAYLQQLQEKPNYIIRIDDDDLISPVILQKIVNGKKEIDCYSDFHNVLYNLYNGKMAHEAYSWMPSTIAMKYKDAVTPIDYFNNLPLFACDHDVVYHKFYSNKKVQYSEKNSPVYMRIISPTCLTLSQLTAEKKIEFGDFTKTLGYFEFDHLNDFEPFKNDLYSLAKRHFNQDIQPNFSPVSKIINKTQHKITNLSKRVLRKIRKK